MKAHTYLSTMKKTDYYGTWKTWKIELEFLMSPVHTAEDLQLLCENIPNNFFDGTFADVTSIEIANKVGTIQMSLDYSNC